MKNYMGTHMVESSPIGADFERVKEIVTLFKKVCQTYEIEDGFSLVQEAETRLGIVHDVISRFLKAYVMCAW